MSEGVNTTTNGTEPSSCPNRDPTATKIGETFVYCLIFLVSLAGNTVIGIIVYKTKTMRKPINFFIINMAMSDLLFPIFSIPRAIQMRYVDSWLIDGPLGQTLCKLATFLPDISALVSIQRLILVAVDRFEAVVFPLRYPLISSKLCSFFVPATWIVAMAVLSPYLFVMKLYGYPGGLRCRMRWNEAFGESFSFKKLLSVYFGRIYFYSVRIDSHTLHYYLFKAQVAEDSRPFPNLFVMKLEYSRGLECGMHWNGVFGETLSFKNDFLTFSVVFTFIPCLLIATLYIIVFLKLKSKKLSGEQSTNI